MKLREAVHRVSWFVGLAVFVVACRLGEDVDDGLRVSFRSSTATIAPGDTAAFTLVLRNIGQHSATVHTPHCPHYFAVHDSAGLTAGPPATACFAYGLLPTTLMPGESMVVLDYWAADSGRAYYNDTRRIDAGGYRLVAGLWGQHRQVLSEPLPIRIQ